MVNIMAADALAMLEAKTSSTMILTKVCQNIPSLAHFKSWAQIQYKDVVLPV